MSSLSRRNLIKTAGVGAIATMGAGISSTAGAASKESSHHFDVIAIGEGPAGLVCAIRAHDAGAKVCVIEKRDRPDGNSIYALGTVCAWGTKWQKACGIQAVSVK